MEVNSPDINLASICDAGVHCTGKKFAKKYIILYYNVSLYIVRLRVIQNSANMKENFTVIIPLLGKQCVIWPNECECELRPIQNIENKTN